MDKVTGITYGQLPPMKKFGTVLELSRIWVTHDEVFRWMQYYDPLIRIHFTYLIGESILSEGRFGPTAVEFSRAFVNRFEETLSERDHRTELPDRIMEGIDALSTTAVQMIEQVRHKIASVFATIPKDASIQTMPCGMDCYIEFQF